MITRDPSNDGGTFPASPAQERMWFLENLRLGTADHHIAWATRLSGSLNRDRLRRALADVAGRHEALRTRFVSRDGVPLQRVEAQGSIDLAFETMPSAGGGDLEGLVRSRLEREAAGPFDLSRAPLARALLLRLSGTEHVLMLTLHHIIADGWSLGVLARDLATFYRGDGASLPELKLHYADLAAWQRSTLTDASLRSSLGTGASS